MIRRFVGFFIAFSTVLAVPVLKLHAQSGFNGTITWAITIAQLGDDEKHDMKVNIKGDRTETETDLGAMGMVKSFNDPVAKKNYVVMGESKSGFFRDIPTDSAIKASALTLNLKSTGHKDTIAGRISEEYTFKDGPADVSIWASGGFPKSLLDRSQSVAQQDNVIPNALKELSKKGLFPVKVVISQQGDVAATMEYVKYEEKNLDDALFVPPVDVKFGPMPQAGGGGTN
jgi:hypothetical protein